MTDLQARALTADDVSRITTALDNVDQDAIVVRPHQDNSGIFGMDEVLRSLPRANTKKKGVLRRRKQNTSAPFAFEMRYAPDPVASAMNDERVLSLQYVGGAKRTSELLGRQLPDKYPDSRTEHRPASWLTPDEGQHMAVATLGLRRYTLYPLKNVELDEFRNDPTGSILTEMVGAADARGVDADVAVQVMVRPAGTDWQNGVPGGYGVADSHGAGLTEKEDKVTSPLSTQKLRWFLNQPTYERRAILPTPIGSALGFFHPFFRDEFEHPPSKADKQAAKMLSDLDGRGWEFHVRIVAISDDPGLARERVISTAEMFDNFYEYRGAQTFIPIPQNGSDAIDVATQAAGREWPNNPEQRMVKPQIEVAGLTNIPEAEHVSTNKLRWALASPGEGIPPGTARFNYDTHGLDAATATREETQVAMLDTAGDDEPIWYGTGVKYGTEAGVFQDTLYHQFVGGATRQGKTTFLTNFVSQGYRGSGAGLVIDPKGLDGDEFIAEWPEERNVENLVTVDLSDEFDRIPRFNFLEIPDYLEPGERAHTSYCEALAEDIVAMVAEAGGSDNYLGALMKRVVKTVVRGLAKTDQTATLLDVAAVCASSENLTRFRQQMDDNRFEFLRETAERLEERDDTDLEPLAGRMDEWVLNDNVRELICARESSFSINDVVENGKWVIVRFDKASSETEVAMVGTALIRRTYFAQRHLRPDHSFDLVCDEFDNIASEESNIHKILSEAAAFDYRCTLACQAPTNQLPERVRHAIENQCGTFLSFNPGGGKDAGWISQQHTVDKEELLNLPRYKFYMRATTRDDDYTHSYMVEGFPPAREARGEPQTDKEIRELKLASLDKYGDTVESAAEQRAASPYYSGDDHTPTSVNDARDIDTATDKRARDAALEAIYDESIRQGRPGDFVPIEACLDRLNEYLPARGGVETAERAWRHVLKDIPEAFLDYREESGQSQVKVRSRSFMNVGDSENDGGAEHWAPMADAYVPMTQLGFIFEIPDQTGDAMPDGLARVDEMLAIDDTDDPEAITAKVTSYRDDHALLNRLAGAKDAYIESEHTTGSTQPSQTVKNLAQAHNAEHRCLFFAREDVAENVYETVAYDPFCCRSNHPVADERRFYTGTQMLTIDGETMTRPGSRENVWVHDEPTDEYVLRDDDGTIHARFESAADIFTDASAYPSGGERNIKPPVIPEYEMDGDLSEVEWDVIVVPPETQTPMDIRLYEGDTQTPLTDLVNDVSSYQLESNGGSADELVTDSERDEHEMDNKDDVGTEREEGTTLTAENVSNEHDTNTDEEESPESNSGFGVLR